MYTKSPEHQSRQRLETVNVEKNKTASLSKTNHRRRPCNAEELCNEEDMTLLWPILGVNSKGEKGRDPRCPSAKRCTICSSRCPEDNIKSQCKACQDPLHRRGCDVREVCETARRNTIKKKKDIIRSSGLSSLEELKEKKLVTLSPYPPHRGSSQPPGSKRTREDEEEEAENGTERSVRARSISRSCLPRKALLSGYCSMMNTPSRISAPGEEILGQERKELEPDRVSGSKP